MNVLLVAVEDDLSVIKQRLMAAGADEDRVISVKGPAMNVGGFTMPDSPLMLGTDAGQLLQASKDHNARALFLETMVEHIGDRDGKTKVSTNNEAEVRRALAPFRAVCQEARMAGLGIMHPRKGTEGSVDEAIGGSIAFRNVARGVMGVYNDPTDETKDRWRLLCSGKSNYLRYRPHTLRFRVEPWDVDPDIGHVVWGIDGRTLIDDRSMEDVWADMRESRQKKRVRKDHAVVGAEKFLHACLEMGPVPEKELKEKAKAEGLSWASIRRAKSILEIESHSDGFQGKHSWKLPEDKQSDY